MSEEDKRRNEDELRISGDDGRKAEENREGQPKIAEGNDKQEREDHEQKEEEKEKNG